MLILLSEHIHVFGVTIDIIAQKNKEVRVLFHHAVEDRQRVVFVAAGAKGNFSDDGIV